MWWLVWARCHPELLVPGHVVSWVVMSSMWWLVCSAEIAGDMSQWYTQDFIKGTLAPEGTKRGPNGWNLSLRGQEWGVGACWRGAVGPAFLSTSYSVGALWGSLAWSVVKPGHLNVFCILLTALYGTWSRLLLVFDVTNRCSNPYRPRFRYITGGSVGVLIRTIRAP